MKKSAKKAIYALFAGSPSIVLLKTPPTNRKLGYNENKKAKKITHMLAIFVDHGIMAHILLSNDPVFNNANYTMLIIPCSANMASIRVIVLRRFYFFLKFSFH